MSAPCDQAAAVREGEELDLARLQPFLREHFGDDGPLSIEQFSSGHSNLTYLVRLGSREAVLRRPPFGSRVKSAHDMAREFRVLSKILAVYPLAPKAILYCDDLSILGAPFYLMEPIQGLILRRDLPTDLPFPPATARRLSETFLDNVVLHPDDLTRIAGVLDWEMCTLGDPLTDLGTALAYWTDPNDLEDFREIRSAPTIMAGTLTRGQLVERYAAVTGRDTGDMVFYLAFARFKVAVIVQQIYYRYAQGLTRDTRFACLPKRIHALLHASWQCAESGII
jgi:aminoglycoside phosphotransferase (APT) family kinase protein